MAVVIALGVIYVPVAFRLVEQARKYPGLLKLVKQLTEEKEELEGRLALEAGQAQSRYTDGLREGRAEVVGAVNAARSNAQLRMEALSLRDGDVYFAASRESGDIPPVGSRFSVEVRATGETKGYVVVERWEEARRLVWLRPVATVSSQPFWDRMKALAEQGADAPESLAIALARLSPEYLGVDPKTGERHEFERQNSSLG